MPIPTELAYVRMGERFGVWPPLLRRRPVSEIFWMRRVLGAEGAALGMLSDLADDEVLINEDDPEDGA